MIVQALVTEIEAVRRNWGWFLVLGIALIVLGSVALVAAGVTTLASVMLFGWLVLVGGVFEAAAGFWARQWSGFFLHLLVGVLQVVVGALVVGHPVAAAAGLTLVLSALFLTGGLFRVVSATVLRFPNWGWSVLDGAVTLALGVLIWAEWPSSALWVIGTYVGVTLVFRGWAWVMFALAVRRAATALTALDQRATGGHVSSPV